MAGGARQNEARRFTARTSPGQLQAIAEADAQVEGTSRVPILAVERAITVIATSGHR
ncbi:hypothetical protein QJS66_03725 [Kocuria rhizophila]|nr:hypothetical protein QJS66_03725 [Kocuria rhizophila]